VRQHLQRVLHGQAKSVIESLVKHLPAVADTASKFAPKSKNAKSAE